MRRLALVLVALAAVVATAAAGGGDARGHRYRIELDNAFGLSDGADVKVAGVEAGTITGFDVDRATKRALVGIELDRELRADAFCESRPQSLIGEYFIDCRPGQGAALADGAKLPVTRTGSTVAPDLVNNILRLPYRQRLRIILAELGIGLAARGQDLNATIRRASPALRETDRVLAILARENRTLRALTADADTVITALARNRAGVGRWVGAARDAAVHSAERRAALAETLRRLPGFLEQLQPAMRELGRVADEQAPALRDLDASSRELERLFDDLGPFSRSFGASLRSLGDASVTGRQAVTAARPVVRRLRSFAGPTPEVAKNLRFVLRDLDDPERAVEIDPRAAVQRGVKGPTGYTGLEALLQYVFNQSQAINVYDQNGYMLKIAVEAGGDCTPYRDAESLKADPTLIERCASWYGPNQPGVTTPDTTATAARERAERTPAPGRPRWRPQPEPTAVATAAPSPSPTAAPPPGGLIDQVTSQLPPIRLSVDPTLLDFLLGP